MDSVKTLENRPGLRVYSEEDAEKCAKFLVNESITFVCEPWPDNQWLFKVRQDKYPLFREFVNTLRNPRPTTKTFKLLMPGDYVVDERNTDD